jgi:hypothetical protein
MKYNAIAKFNGEWHWVMLYVMQATSAASSDWYFFYGES